MSLSKSSSKLVVLHVTENFMYLQIIKIKVDDGKAIVMYDIALTTGKKLSIEIFFEFLLSILSLN